MNMRRYGPFSVSIQLEWMGLEGKIEDLDHDCDDTSHYKGICCHTNRSSLISSTQPASSWAEPQAGREPETHRSTRRLSLFAGRFNGGEMCDLIHQQLYTSIPFLDFRVAHVDPEIPQCVAENVSAAQIETISAGTLLTRDQTQRAMAMHRDDSLTVFDSHSAGRKALSSGWAWCYAMRYPRRARRQSIISCSGISAASTPRSGSDGMRGLHSPLTA